MKKILLTVSALGLAMVLTASVAAAEMSFTAGGKYNLTGMFISDGGGDPSAGGMLAGPLGDNDNNDMWHQSFYLYPKLQVNDNIKMIGELRFIDRDILGATDSVHQAGQDYMRVFKMWMEYTSPIGTLSAGRMPAGTWGSKFLDSTGAADRIKLSIPVSDTVGVAFIYQKTREEDTFHYDEKESDIASYYAGVSLKSDMGKTDAAIWHTVNDGDWNDKYSNSEIWLNGAYTIGPVNLVSELKYVMGEDSNYADIASLGFMLDASTKIDTMTAGILFFYGQGDMDSSGDNEGYVTRKGFGNDFNPFLIATNDYTGFLNGDKNGYLAALDMTPDSDYEGNGDNPGALALALYGVMPISDVLTINAAIGHVWADDVGTSGFDDAVGWEVDLGMSYKLLDNLTYSAQFGYMKPGDMLEDAATYYSTTTNDILMVVHELTMTF